MAKWWSLLFGVTMFACLGLFLVAPFVGWWLPEGVSTHSDDVDGLFYLILYITGIAFVLTTALMVIFMWQFGSKTDADGNPEKPTSPMLDAAVAPLKKYFPTEARVEMAWTIVPAAILIFIAWIQVGTWGRIKYQSNAPRPDGYKIKNAEGKFDVTIPLQVDVSARQFEWRFRYPSPERWESWKKELKKTGKAKQAKAFISQPHADDVYVVNELHIWTNEKAKSDDEYPSVLTHLSTLDVQHNFNLPSFRVKQDALPGKIIPVWFRPTKANYEYQEGVGWKYNKDRFWEIACAELCGRSHYNMKAKIFVHPDEESFLRWLKSASVAQRSKTR